MTLEPRADGKVAACFEGYALGLGTLSAAAADRAKELRAGLPLSSFVSSGRKVDREVEQLVRRLARHGLLEYRLRGSRNGHDLVVIEPQMSDYWPQTPRLGNAEILVLSRFAYMRRRGNDMVLESPRSAALFKICDPRIAGAIARLSTPRQIKELRRQDGFPGVELLALLLDCQILFQIDAARDDGLSSAEGDGNLVLWDFHDLLFHTRSTEGRQANPLGGLYAYAGATAPLPAVRPSLAGKENRSTQVVGHTGGAKLAGRQASARTSFDPHLRRRATDHARRTVAVSRGHRTGAGDVEQQHRPRRGRSGRRVRGQALSLGRRGVRA